MIDMHYDLLSVLYYCYLRNDFRYVKELQGYFNDKNVHGLVANLYFMSEEEMKELTLKEVGDGAEIESIEKMIYIDKDSQASYVYKVIVPNF